jgi:hypothetical protein
MRNGRFSVEQMIGVLKQAEVGVPAALMRGAIRKATSSESGASGSALEAFSSSRIPQCRV